MVFPKLFLFSFQEKILGKITSHLPSQHVYAIRPRNDKRGVDLISDALPFGRLWQLEVSHAIGYLKFYSRSHDAVI